MESVAEVMEVAGSVAADPTAFEETVRYLLETLHLKFYVLVITRAHELQFYRVESPEGLLPEDRNLRVMRCILTPLETKEKTDVPHEYLTFFGLVHRRFCIPPGAYIFTLTDAVVIAAKKVEEPWPRLVGLAWGARPGSAVPVFNGSGARGYRDVPVPNYDDVRYVLGYDKIDWDRVVLDWDKKIPRAVWRGSTTGCGATPDTNPRLRLAVLAAKLRRPDVLDAGVTNVSSKERIDPKLGRRRIKPRLVRPVPRIPFEDFSCSKYILNLPGNVAAFRLAKLLAFGSVVLNVDSPYTLWYSRVLKPWVHYIPVSADLSDLLGTIQWCREHDADARRIAEAGRAVGLRLLEADTVLSAMADIFFKN